MIHKLKNKKIAITRDSRQSSHLIKRLTNHGASVLTWPVIKIKKTEDYKEFDQQIAKLRSDDWIVFSSVNAVRHTLPRIFKLDVPLEKFKIASVGPSTSQALQDAGIIIDFTAQPHSAVGLIKHFRTKDIKNKYIMLPSSDLARDELEKGLSSLGARILRSATYRITTNKRLNKLDILSDCKKKHIDCLVFFSPSAFHALLEITDDDILEILKSGKIILAAIGPTTARAINDKGIEVSIIPKESSSDSLIQALLEYFYAKPEGR